MGKTYAAIDDAMKQFLEQQPIFFVGSAPLDPQGHMNISPKGLDTFRVLGPKTVAYLDLTGSGIETVAHVKENGRIVLMFCAFDGPPKIVRLYGQGRVVEPRQEDFQKLLGIFPAEDSVRSVIVVELFEIADSCGLGVPLFQPQGQREQLPVWARKIGPNAIKEYQRKNNLRSRDGLPGISA